MAAAAGLGIPTRASLRREFEASVPLGAESSLLADESRALAAARERLRALRSARVDLARRAAEHRRKLHDWKGKIPRALGAPPPPRPPPTPPMPCVAVAELVRPTRVGRDKGASAALCFLAPYVRAMEGIERFEKAWIVLRAPAWVSMAGVRNTPSVCHPGELHSEESRSRRTGGAPHAGGKDSKEKEETRLHLVLVDIVERRGRSAMDKELLVVNGLDADAILRQTSDIFIIDIKPYLSYCEAFPDNCLPATDHVVVDDELPIRPGEEADQSQTMNYGDSPAIARKAGE
jgi:tRNA (Thr-GGU) A37 N-methylase